VVCGAPALQGYTQAIPFCLWCGHVCADAEHDAERGNSYNRVFPRKRDKKHHRAGARW